MPAERKAFTTARPAKTERTHEENQERAYIAASRRSDRSLEARIESARRASEIHKKRTGRALRVTEQDVINEEMYEEEDDDLPTQYLRLNAHLHTTSLMFNKKLHDYIATQHGVRNMFMSQYQNATPAPFGGQLTPNANGQAQPNNWLNTSMLPPQQFNPSSPGGFNQPSPSTYSPTTTQAQTFRQSPYQIPQRLQPHQRALSTQLPPAANFDGANQQPASAVTTPLINRRLSAPVPHAEQPTSADSQTSRPPLPHSATAASLETTSSHDIASPASHATSPIFSTANTSATTSPTHSFHPTFPLQSQVLGPLSLSLPPEAQQFVGSALDPSDPRTALFMAGSEALPQPFAPSYTYNPNFLQKTGRALGDETLAPPPAGIKSESAVSAAPTGLPMSVGIGEMGAGISDGFYSTEAFLTPGNSDYNAFFDFQAAEFSGTPTAEGSVGDGGGGGGSGDGFVNWD